MIRHAGAACFAVLLIVAASSTSADPLPIFERGLLPGDTSIAPATQSQQDHAVAKGGDQYLVVWSDYRGQAVGGGSNQSGADVLGIRLDSSGAPIDPAPFLIAGGMGLQRTPLVAWNGDTWLVLYSSQDPVGGYYEHRIRAVRVSSQGQILDPTPILLPSTLFSSGPIGLQLAGQGGQWLATGCVYHDGGYGTFLAAQRIDGSGQLLDPTPIMIIDWVYGATKLVAANGEYLAAGPDWTTSSITKAIRVGLDAQPIGSSFNVPSLNIAGNGSEYYVTWIANYVQLVGSRMTLGGTLLTPAGTVILSDISQYSESTLTHDGSTWWLEWGAADRLHTVRINSAGSVLDPNGGPLLPIVIGGSVNSAYGPVLAPRAGGGVHLLWYDLRVALGYDTNVFLLPINAANVAGAERCVSTGTRSQRTPDLTSGPGTEIAVVFVSEAANDDRVLVHFLGSDGLALLGEPITVATAVAVGRASIAWNGALFLVAWDESATGTPSQIKARRMNPDGSFVDALPIDVMPGFSPDVEALGDDFLIATARVHTYPQFIYAWMRILDGPTATFLNSPTLIGGGYVSVGPRVHTDGTRWIVTYQSNWTHDDARSDAVYNFVSPDGSFTPALNPATTSGGSGTPDVAFSGQKYLFVWRNNTLANANNYIAGRIMNADGSFAGGNFTIAEAPGRQLRPVVGWDGTSFVVAWDDQRHQESFFDERTDIYGARVSEAGAVLDPTSFPIFVGPQGDATAAILSRSNGVSYVASARFQTAPPFDSYRIGITVLGQEGTSGIPGAPTPSGRWSLRSAPNPFGPATQITFGIERPGPIALRVHDVMGRTVAVIAQGEFPSGEFTTTWNGQDRQGRRLAAGSYFLALEAGGREITRKVQLVR